MNRLKKILFSVAITFSVFAASVAQPLTVTQSSVNNYVVTVSATSPKYKLVWNTTPDSWKKAQSISIKTSPETVVLASAHPIIKFKTKKETFYAAPRGVTLKGAANFRDLGGYKTTDGHQVKWGKIYRSADISKLNDEDVKTLSDLNIKMVCDLRGEQEVATAPDRLPEGTERILLSAGSENVGGAGSYMKYMKNPNSADSMMAAFYTRTDHLAKKYKPIFDQLLALETDKALMFHCTAGKDRTGIGAAMILYALGVDEKTIFQDYELTNEFRKESNEQYIKMLTSQGLPEKSARSMMAAKPEYLRAAFDAINKNFGSIDAFLEKEIGLNSERRNNLKMKFLN